MSAPIALVLLPDTIGPYISLMVLGFGVGIIGHLARSKVVVAIGIGMIFLATVLLPLVVIATKSEPQTPGQKIYPPGTRSPVQ